MSLQDYECFTILSQDEVPALQVLNANNQWIMAKPMKNHFVVNIGDFFSFWYVESSVNPQRAATGTTVTAKGEVAQ